MTIAAEVSGEICCTPNFIIWGPPLKRCPLQVLLVLPLTAVAHGESVSGDDCRKDSYGSPWFFRVSFDIAQCSKLASNTNLAILLWILCIKMRCFLGSTIQMLPWADASQKTRARQCCSGGTSCCCTTRSQAEFGWRRGISGWAGWEACLPREGGGAWTWPIGYIQASIPGPCGLLGSVPAI